MVNAKVSVIIPVYNVDKYLDRCVSSVMSSENTNLQILLIDDGSTDLSGKKCDSYAAKDPRITVIHKQNGGVSSARNAAIPLVDGDWTVFVDADDSVSPDFLTIPDCLLNADAIEKGYSTLDERGNIVSTHYISAGTFNRKALLSYYFSHGINAVWNKIIRSDIVKSFRFEEGLSLGEDLFFFMSVMTKIQKYEFCPKGYYNYTDRISSGKNGDTVLTSLRIKNLLTWAKTIDRNDSLYQPICPFHKTLLFDIYLRELYVNRNVLDKGVRDYVCRHFANMKWSDLSLMPFKCRLRLFYWHLIERFS